MKTATKKLKTNRERIWEIDFLRGFCICLMMIDHALIMTDFLFDSWVDGFLNEIKMFASDWYGSPLRNALWPIAIFLFFFLSGTSTSFSKKPIWSTLKLVVASILFNLATVLVSVVMNDKSAIVYFGILNCFALTRLIYCGIFYLAQLARRLIDEHKKKQPQSSIDAASVLTNANQEQSADQADQKQKHRSVRKYLDSFRALNHKNMLDGVLIIVLMLFAIGSIIIGYHFLLPPLKNLRTTNYFFLFLFPPKASTLDYYSLFPYAGFFIIGIMFGRVAYLGLSDQKSLLPINRKKTYGKVIYAILSPFNFLGRYSLFVYVLHIPVVLGILTLASIIGGFGVPFS